MLIVFACLEKEIDASKGVLSRAIAKGTDISSKWLTRIVEKYPDCNSTWLLTGKGEMFENNVEHLSEPREDYLKVCKMCQSLEDELLARKREIDLQYKHISKLEANLK